MKTAIELSDAIDNSEETTGFERRCASMLRTLSQENEALKADAERYRKLVAMADLYIGPAYSTYNDSICDGEYCNYSQDKKQLDAFLDLFDAMKGKS